MFPRFRSDRPSFGAKSSALYRSTVPPHRVRVIFLCLARGPVYDLFLRKVIARNKKTQKEMNVLFEGAVWNLAERYTDMVRHTHTHIFTYIYIYTREF